MAYAAVASLLHIDIVLNHHQRSISPQLKDLIVSLQKHTLSLQTFFEEFPHKTNLWEEIISEGTYMAERIIELTLSDSWLEPTVGSSKSKRSKHGKGKYQLPYGIDELKRVTDEIESIVGEVKGERRSKAMDGSDDELMQIISRLRKGGSWLNRIAIYGEEGMGKTTLARNAYNNPLIEEHFDIRAWSTVSREYDRPRVIRDLLRSINADSSSNTEDELIGCVLEKLRGKRYLIVFDDVWDFESSDRRKFLMLPDENNGSRIILTTRFFISVKFVDYFHKVGFTDEDTAWNLLQKRIFKGDSCPSQLESIGKMIARNCRRDRLSIDVVSGILAAADQTEAAWEDISENIKSEASGNRLYRILSLSYKYLPHHLRPCLLYLAIFPNYQDIRVSKLIKLWVTEGFLSESECESFEETGEECVEDLVRRSLVTVGKRKSNGRIKSITIHYAMRDLCLWQAHTGNFILDLNGFDQRGLAVKLQSCRRVSTFTYGDDDFFEGVYGSTIRTVILYQHSSQQDIVKWSIGNVRLLRILDLSNANNYDLPEEVFELFHLRYLAFCSGFSISEAISNLVNLQSLIICPSENDSTFANFPEGIWRMPQLRHLVVFSFKLPTQKEATSALQNLQTLSRVVDFVCSRDNLKMIPNLKKISLFYTNLRDVVEDYKLHNLMYLQKLEILKLEMDWSSVEQHKIMSCAFPPTLKKLSLSNVRYSWEDMKLVGLLPNLQVLKLRNHACIGETWETSEGGFSQLTYLLIDESNLENWITETTHFPKLKCLVLRCSLHLLEVPNDIGVIPTLELIELDEQNNSLLCSAKRIQKDRQSLGDDHLQIRVV